MKRLLVLVLCGLLVSCGGDSPSEPAIASGPANTYESIAGTYTGALMSVSQGVTLSANFSLTLVQTVGSLSGSFRLTGTLDDGIIQASVLGSGTVTGTVDPGSNPSVSVTMTPEGCPDAAVTWSGAYTSANGLLTISGVANIFDAACVVFLTYEGTMILDR